MSTTNLSKIKLLKKAMLDALFPIFCLSCRKEGSWLCEKCSVQMKISDIQVCPACENCPTDRGVLCPACREAQKSSLDCLIVSAAYEDPVIKKLVHSFKYRFASDISSLLGKLVCRALIRNDIVLPDFIAPVPLHPKRLRWRGFNQSLLLAAYVSERIAPLMELKILDVLERQKYNRPQMEIKNRRERLQNVRDIFQTKFGADLSAIQGKTILLIDDIATTGATLEECAKVLKSAGAKKVFAAVVARQSVKK